MALISIPLILDFDILKQSFAVRYFEHFRPKHRPAGDPIGTHHDEKARAVVVRKAVQLPLPANGC